MKTIRLDIEHIHTVRALHIYLAYMLDLPAHYGKNLDALYDVLTERGEETVLRVLESDRLESVSAMLRALGGDARIEGDTLVIRGGKPLRGGRVNSVNDHRIAMSAAVAALLCSDRVELEGAEAVEKSYPAFWADYARLSGKQI